MMDDKIQRTDVFDFGIGIFTISDLGLRIHSISDLRLRIADFKKGKKPYFNP